MICRKPEKSKIDYSKRMSERMKKLWRNKNYRKQKIQNHSQIMKELWNDPEYRERMKIRNQKISKTMKRKYREDPIFHKHREKAIEKLKQNLDWKARIAEINKEKWEKPKYRESKIEDVKRQWNNPDIRQNMVRGLRKAGEDQNLRTFRSKQAKKQWDDPNIRKQMIQNMLKACHAKPNKKEQELIKLFKQNDLPYEFIGNGNILIAGRSPDFINRSGQKKIIEFFGQYWHNLPNSKKRDRMKLKIFRKAGFRVLVIWEYTLRNKKHLLTRIKKFDKK